jgi:hypothetical protein
MIELFDEEMFLMVSNSFDEAVRINDTTVIASTGKYMRVCVEIDLGMNPLVPIIKVLSVKTEVCNEA